MKTTRKQRILAHPPVEYHWLEDLDDLERLGVIYSKLGSIASFFSHYGDADANRPALASEVYGFWHIIWEICRELADILKIDHWTGEIGKKSEGDEA